MKVKLIIGMLASREKMFYDAEKHLESIFGDIDYSSAVLPFTYTDYYENEMGENLLRKFIAFKRLINPEDIVHAKIETRSIEKLFCCQPGQRRINIDPGYVNGAKLVLATTKDYDHRIYLGDGIYAEVTLHFRGETFTPWEWTYPDYRTREYIDIFNRIRVIYFQDIKEIEGR